MLLDIFLLIVAYLIGSIPSGLLIARMCGIEDIRTHGSGNIGATNVSRVLGYKYFLIVLAADSFKAYAYLAFLQLYGFKISTTLILSAIALFFGNAASVFLHFSGGKGIATLLGILAGISPSALGYMIMIWCAALAVIKRVGIASVVALLTLPGIMFLVSRGSIGLTLFACVVSGAGIFFHRKNIESYFNYYT